MAASDEDSGLFGSVKYSILSVSGDGQNKFVIEAGSGQIFVTQTVVLDEVYILTVQGEDMGSIGSAVGRRLVLFLFRCLDNVFS